jgi:hypothetical protein
MKRRHPADYQEVGRGTLMVEDYAGRGLRMYAHSDGRGLRRYAHSVGKKASPSCRSWGEALSILRGRDLSFRGRDLRGVIGLEVPCCFGVFSCMNVTGDESGSNCFVRSAITTNGVSGLRPCSHTGAVFMDNA